MAEEDLIFGKNRHFFGGIEPSNMKTFTAEVLNGVVTITATLPEDTVINGQTLCPMEGAVIRRKTGDYPKDEFDGDLVADLKMSSVFADTGAAADGTYYYAAFPYSAQGVYNKSRANRAVVNEPAAMAKFAVQSKYDFTTETANIEITAKLPENVAGALIRRSTVSYPTTEAEGDLVFDITADGTYTDTGVTIGVVYYYAAFPYTSTGNYCRSEADRAAVTPNKRTYLYGFDINNSTASPSGRVVYPSDVDNANYTPAAMNFTTSTFDYGSWTLAPGEHFMPRPCMLYYTGKVAYYLNPDDYTLKEDGTASDVADLTFDGNAMMEWPKIYTKRWEEDGVYHFRCSDTPQDADWDCWCNYDRQDNVIPHFYTAIYQGYYYNSMIRSMSRVGATTIYYSSGERMSTIDPRARTTGEDWYIETVGDRLLINDLLILLAKTTDAETAYGLGNSGGAARIPQKISTSGDTDTWLSTNVTSNDSGLLNKKGMFFGYNTIIDSGSYKGKNYGVKVFGMENYWGNEGRVTAGWMSSGAVQNASSTYVYHPYLKITRGTHDGTTVSDFSGSSAEGYLDPGIELPYNSYFATMSMKVFPYGRLPSVGGGSTSTYECDGSSWIGTTIKKGSFTNSFEQYTGSDFFGIPWGGCMTMPSGYSGPWGWLPGFSTTYGNNYMITYAPSCKPLLSIQEGD